MSVKKVIIRMINNSTTTTTLSNSYAHFGPILSSSGAATTNMCLLVVNSTKSKQSVLVNYSDSVRPMTTIYVTGLSQVYMCICDNRETWKKNVQNETL